MTERRWPLGLRVRPVGALFFVTPEHHAVYGSMTGTVVEPTYSLSRGGWLEWWVDDGQADRWVIADGWEIEPIPPIWVRQGRPKPPKASSVESLVYGERHGRPVVWKEYYEEEHPFCWVVDCRGSMYKRFRSWQEAIDYANELAYNRG